MQKKTIELDLDGEKVTFTTGVLAPRAGGTVQMQIGETVVFAVATADKADSQLDYFPLGIEYIEKLYAGGVISGSRFVKREMRPAERAIIVARQVDHSIRSLFPKGFKKPVSVIITVQSYDGEHRPEDMAVTAASMALMLSAIPFEGPSASVSVGIKNDGSLLLNPKGSETELSSHFVVSSTSGGRILNIEGFADETPEDKMDELLDLAVENTQKLIDVQISFQKEAGKEKVEFSNISIPEDLIAIVKDKYTDQITESLFERDKEKRKVQMETIKKELVDMSSEDNDITPNNADTAVEYIAKKIMRASILSNGKRSSGRKLDEIRQLSIEVGVLPRVHGSALFSRGLTQSLTITTLGSTRLAQTLDGFDGESTKSFMHHYNGPSYSFGEAGRFSYYPGRREIGHGHITENAFYKILPSLEEFPYTIRVVSEIMSQNGSSSMAAATATTLSLMDAGVPIKTAVAGIAMGLVTADNDEGDYELLTDMEDIEDFYGDMDFKVTGTKKGITSIQLDNKLKGVPIKIIKEAFRRSKLGREFIIEQMSKVISEPRAELSKYAPRVEVVRIKKDKIGDLIGPGGKNIKKIMEVAGEGTDINIEEDGLVTVTAVNEDSRKIAIKMIEDTVGEAEVGKTYEGTVDKVTSYGAFVDVTPAISGLVHVSELTDGFVKDPSDVVKEGQSVKVKVIGIDDQGRIKLSIKQAE